MMTQKNLSTLMALVTKELVNLDVILQVEPKSNYFNNFRSELQHIHGELNSMWADQERARKEVLDNA